MKTDTPRKPSVPAALPPSRPPALASTPNEVLDGVLERLIRQRAHQLYEQRGCQDGFAERDWLQAEQEVLRNLARAVA